MASRRRIKRFVCSENLGEYRKPTVRSGRFWQERNCSGSLPKQISKVQQGTMKRSQASTLVYSTEDGRHCRKCGHSVSACQCRKQSSSSANIAAGDGIVRLGRQTKGRKGSGVTVITGLALEPAAMEQLARELKKLCASGGRVMDGTIEIQGEHRQTVQAELQQRGFKVKLAGG